MGIQSFCCEQPSSKSTIMILVFSIFTNKLMIGNASNMRFGTMIYIRARNNCMFAWDISGPVTLFLVFLSSHVFVTIMCCTLNFKVGCGEEFNLIRNIKLVMVRVFQLRFLLTWFRPLQISDWRSYWVSDKISLPTVTSSI